MNSSHRHRRPRKVRRTGRHARPSQVQNVAETAYKAAPAMAIAGALIAAPAVHAAGAGPARGPARVTAVAQQMHAGSKVAAQAAAVVSAQADALVVHHEQARHYTVRPGDTLSSIAQRFYGSAADWQRLYQANRSVIQNPNVIQPGEVLSVPYGTASSATSATSAPTSAPARAAAMASSAMLSGTLTCPGLEELWEEAGGSHTEAFMAASIAMAESSGRQFATGGAGERGYWQIHPDHGALSTYDPLGNAKAAVIISNDGTNWTPWTTFTSGAYHGRC